MEPTSPTQTVRYDACVKQECRNAARDVAVQGARLDSLDKRLDELQRATEMRIDHVHRDLTDFRNTQAEMNGRICGTSEQVLKTVGQLSHVLLEGNGQPSVVNRLAEVEYRTQDAAKGLAAHVEACAEQNKSRATWWSNVLQVIGGIIAAVVGGVVGVLVSK